LKWNPVQPKYTDLIERVVKPEISANRKAVVATTSAVTIMSHSLRVIS